MIFIKKIIVIKIFHYRATLVTTSSGYSNSMIFTGGKPQQNLLILTPWGSLKQYLRTSYKPTNLDELMQGIEEFWSSLTPDVCRKYIRYLQRKAVAVDGNPSGY